MDKPTWEMTPKEYLDYDARQGPDQPPDYSFQFLLGKEVKEKYPELWESICELENFGIDENAEEIYDIQTDCPAGFTHLYTNDDLTAVVLAEFPNSDWEYPRKCNRILTRRITYDSPFATIHI